MFVKNITLRLQSISLSVWRYSLLKHILFAVATLVSLLTMGYYFGTLDQASHIPFLKKFADPSLYPNDYFIDLRLHHYSFFWFLFIPFYKLGILEISMFVTYIGVLYLTFWGLWNISKKLFNNPLTSFLTIFVFMLPHIGFSGFPVVEWTLVNRIFVLPFLLMAINLYLDKRYISAFFLLGILYNLHIVSVNFVLFMFLFASLIKIREIRYQNIIAGFIAFIIGALPVLIWKFGGSPVQLESNPEWFWVVSRGVLYHLFFLFGSNFYAPLLTLGGVSSIILFLIARKALAGLKHTTTISLFMIALFIIIVVQAFASYIYPSTIIIQSQIFRAGLFINVFALLYFTHYVVKLYGTKKINNLHFVLLITTIIFSVIPAVLLVVLLIRKVISSQYWVVLTSFIVPIAFVTLAILGYALNVWQPGIHIYPQKSAYVDVQLWARSQTDKTDVFITPPNKSWFYYIEWRVGSDRSSIASLFDIAEIAVVPQGLSPWKERFEKLAPGVIQKFNGDPFASIRQTLKAYYSLSAEDFKRIAKTYKASYLVIEKPHRYELPKVFENEGYTVYDVKSDE
ncbi:hypothetical protein A3A46_02055 [Candidatus Roizmanbacteria bacterium RIFCSPLOWO2_01_FULL_37_13]|uniref:Glycosyltransferase RgtA/B/C/D-like domain-containing protein n=1 Tax=Candidatus Roizmanbacteria bacterium RIFCSPHIGHO2_02_FULL_38_11 TaxID=1802039 RepID=A0A1F7GYS9_9BACT|nr:MAG: hypothetical protein A3C25_00970 [Candidatus Roizmanbacteria bacterium RIFCSPHIGHO2_02_FULL_38_11]OGK35186.1 MAG: hypothetical protein A3F58_03855 [Candidatus Roizmanbacteria bacterium RIFCSPHIGHO2_12_FULL_37_9b]OGK42868.1 MAG: hypothetical protein A3A46_02055 [Candidatus Roizmanbacteria bacterium RIFCSPLOWO2_01_FULL_37_13]